MDQPKLFERVVDLSRQVVASTETSMFDRSTPCPDWNVRQLVNHMAITLRYSRAVMAGSEPSEDRLSSEDVLGTAWQEAYATAADAAIAAFTAPGAMEREIDAPPGRIPGGSWVSFPTWDIYVHTWDLSKATGRPTDRDEELTNPILAWAERTFSGSRDVSEFGDLVNMPADAPPIDRLVAMFGRTP